MDDIDAMFTDLLGEMDALTQSLGAEITAPPDPPKPVSIPQNEINFSVGFMDLNESLNELEDNDLNALMADLVAEINAAEQTIATGKGSTSKPHSDITGLPPPPPPAYHDPDPFVPPPPPAYNDYSMITLPPPPEPTPTPSLAHLPPPPVTPPTSQPTKSLLPEDIEAQAKADKIKLALEKLKEAKVKKLVIKVVMNDGSSKTLMVDERQTVRDVLDQLFEKTYCDCNVDWCLIETNPELHIERGFEDHENLVEPLSAWTRDSENKLYFLERIDKYAVFKNPQNFYLWKKDKKSQQDIKERDKEMLLEENFCKASIIVPDLEGVLYLKEDGKKSWKQRYFLLRASGIYYVPKGKTKTSRDLVCFVQFDNVNVYYGKDYKAKYKAPTDNCFILKHPQIQKESQYIKYLCCDDAWMLTLWVTGIRIAKYGATMYNNYKTAVQKAAAASLFTSRTAAAGSTGPSSTSSAVRGSSQANGHIPPPPAPPPSIANAFSKAWTQADTRDQGDMSSLPPPPPDPHLPPPPPIAGLAPPPPPPPPPASAKKDSQPKAPLRSQPGNFPPASFSDFPLPPPPVDHLLDQPPDFLPPPPPPPPAGGGPPPPPPPIVVGGGPPPPPPPPPPAPLAANPVPLKKVTPPPKPAPAPTPAGPAGGDFMSELRLAMQKKRGGP